MSEVVLWARDDGTVVAWTPTAGLSLADAIASPDVPKDRPHFVADVDDLPVAPIAAWRLSARGVVSVADIPPPPIETSKLRFALELKARGLWPSVKAAIAANEDATLYWDFTDIVRSDNQMLLAMASQLNISAADVRNIIVAAIARHV